MTSTEYLIALFTVLLIGVAVILLFVERKRRYKRRHDPLALNGGIRR